MTHNSDLAITGDSYTKLINLVKDDRRLSETMLGKWEYWSSYDFMGLGWSLLLRRDWDHINELREYSLIDGIPVATPVDLAIGKKTAWVQRKNQKDFTDLQYAVKMMARNRLDFKGLDEQAKELLDDIRMELRGSARGLQLVQVIRRLL